MAIEAALKAKILGIHELGKQGRIFEGSGFDCHQVSQLYERHHNVGTNFKAFQAEIDSACGCDFQLQCSLLDQIWQQPISGAGMHNRMEYRHLKALYWLLLLLIYRYRWESTTAPAMCGNTVVEMCCSGFIRHKCSCVFYRKQVCRMVLSIWFM